MDDKINVVYAVNDLYAHAAAASIYSVWFNTKHKELCRFYVLYLDLLKQNYLKFMELSEQYNIKIQMIEVNSDKIEGLYEVDYFKLEMYLRIFIGDLFPAEKKALYLDCDTIVKKDIKELYDTDLGQNVLGAVYDIPNVFRCKELEKIGIDPQKYFNSGVLLINLNLFRGEMSQKILSLIKNNRSFRCPDQDALNLCCKDLVKSLDLRWNLQWGHYLDNLKYIKGNDLIEYQKALNNCYIIHYTSNNKPWNSFYGAKLSRYFFQYASCTPFWEDVVYSLFNTYLSNANVTEIMDEKFSSGQTGFRIIMKFAKKWFGYKVSSFKTNLKL